MTLTELLTSTDARKARWGIKRASAYVNSFSGCLDGGVCPSSLLGVTGDQWAKCLKEAEERAVYANPAMIVKATSDADLPDGAILGFDCVLTTTRKDRDGDILESAGVTIDQNMPLLWQHLPLQPIGKFIRETSRTKRYVQAKCAIADTPLGRDAATLVKFGALRISHGFMPIEFEPLYNEKDQRDGWHIRKLDIYEISTVSVPSNVEAVILSSVEKSKSFAQELDGIRTAYGRGLLKTDAVKQWAKHFHENRPAQGKGIELPVEPEPLPVKEACSCQTKEGHASKDADAAKDGGADMDEKPLCKCPKCGHRGDASEFKSDDMDADDQKSITVEQKCFAELLKNTHRMRMFRNRLDAVLDATSAESDLVSELLSALA